MNYSQTLEYLYSSLPVFQRIGAAAYKANLDNTIALDDHQGNPHRDFRTIHVAGTNGKGSVSQMIYEVLRASGYSVGLYTSPHLVDFRERIIVDDRMISQEEVVGFVEKHRDFIGLVKPSFFEATVAMAFDHFRRREVDFAVIEVGMGGRLDSTNIISPILSVITNIDYDHTQFLGTTLAEIASEKAGVIKPSIPVVVGETNPETAMVFIEKARRETTSITFADQRYRCDSHRGRIFEVTSLLEEYTFDIELGMSGDYQQRNICTALAAFDLLSEVVDLTSVNVRRGVAAAVVRGRWQKLSDQPLTICDTGHNKAGISYILAQIAKERFEKLIFVIGMVGDKDIDGVLSMLPTDAYYIFTQASIPRAKSAHELQKEALLHSLGGEVVVNVADAVAKAREIARDNDMIFIGGSTFVVAELFSE